METKYTLEDFKVHGSVGVGSYSEVYRVIHRTTQREYALKVVEKRHVLKEKKEKYVMKEKDLLIRCHMDPFIVKLYGTFQDSERLYFLLEYASRGDLNRLQGGKPCPLPLVKALLNQVVDAIEFLHLNSIVHRDIKPENILLMEDMSIRLADFGSALDLTTLEWSETDTLTTTRSHSFVGTADYVPPELIISRKSSQKSFFKAMDLWALGVLAYQLISGIRPFAAETEYLTFQRILSVDLIFPTEIFTLEAISFISSLLVSNFVQGGRYILHTEGEAHLSYKRRDTPFIQRERYILVMN